MENRFGVKKTLQRLICHKIQPTNSEIELETVMEWVNASRFKDWNLSEHKAETALKVKEGIKYNAEPQETIMNVMIGNKIKKNKTDMILLYLGRARSERFQREDQRKLENVKWQAFMELTKLSKIMVGVVLEISPEVLAFSRPS